MAPTRPVVRLLVVDQSPAAREKIRLLFSSNLGVEIVGEAGTSQKALRLLDEVSPTAVLMDCEMPQPGSCALVKEMMIDHRVPIVMLTKKSRLVPNTLEVQALEAGAVAIVALTAEGLSTEKLGQEELVKTVRAMSEVKVVRRRGHGRVSTSASGPSDDGNRTASPQQTSEVDDGRSDKNEPQAVPEIIAIGASTGGPQVLETILRGLSKRLTVPVVAVQHLSQGFQDNLVQWLSKSSGAHIEIARHGTMLTPGVVYLAPDSRHMEVSASGRIVLNDDLPENGSRPSVSVLFRSVAKHYGPRAIGILLTGMGRDGAKELRAMRELGALTIAQDEQSSAVHGMPGEAIKLKGARYILPPDRMVKLVEGRLPPTVAESRKTAAYV